MKVERQKKIQQDQETVWHRDPRGEKHEGTTCSP